MPLPGLEDLPPAPGLPQSRRMSVGLGYNPGTGRRTSIGRPSLSAGQGRRISFSVDDKRRLSLAGYERVLQGVEEEEREREEEEERRRQVEKERRELFEAVLPVRNIKETSSKWQKAGESLEFRSEFHRIMYDFTESRTFAGFILGVILVNTGMLISQTWQIVAIRGGWYFSVLDSIFLGIYIMEMVFKIFVHRTKFFKEGWNILDLSIVIVNLIDFGLPLIIQNVKGFNGAAIFRLLRIFRAVRAIRALRVLRTIRFLANLQVIMVTLMQSVRSIGAIVTLITLFMYMFAVVGRGLYAQHDPEHFGSIFSALFTLFQLLTLDDWFEIHQTVANKGRTDIIVYLFLYIVAEYFVFLNLFVAVLVDNFQLTLEAQNQANKMKRQKMEEEEDEEDYFLTQDSDDESTSSEANDQQTSRKSLRQYFPNVYQVPEKELQTLSHYYQLIAALEYNSNVMNNQERILNLLVDMASEENDDAG